MSFNQEEFNQFVLDNGVVGFFNEPIKFKSGRMANDYVNWRNVAGDVFLLDKLSDFLIDFVRDKNLSPDCFYGVPEGATKLAVLTQFKWAKLSGNLTKGSHSVSMGRAKPKDHGHPKDKFFVGEPRGKVIVIEDTTTTGGSLINSLESLKELDINIIGIIALTNRMEKRDDGLSVAEAIEKIGLNYFCLSNSLDLLPKAVEKFKPHADALKKVEEYYNRYGVQKLFLSGHPTKIAGIDFSKFSDTVANNKNIADKLLHKIDEKQTSCIVGLDPVIEKIPKYLVQGDSFKDIADAFRKFNFTIIDAISDLVPAVKPQIAFYEKYGHEGLKAFKDTVDYAHSKGLIVIEDGKRNDIGSTAQAYAEGHLGMVKTSSSEVFSLNVDMLTVNPYLGSDGLNPFFNVCKEYGKGIFILSKTSNPSSGDFQDRYVSITEEERDEFAKLGINVLNKIQLYNLVALHVNKYAQKNKGKRGYSSIGAVIGATYPEQAEVLRKIIPNSFFLVPGYGAQGGTAEDVMPCFNNDGYGAVINSSRGIIFAYLKKNYPEEKFAEAAREATIEMINSVNSALKKNNKFPANWSDNILQSQQNF